MHWIMSCKQISMLISQSLDTPLPFYRRTGIRVHLMMCTLCRRYNRHLHLIHSLLVRERKNFLENEQLSRQARERILQAVDREMRRKQIRK